MSGSPCRLPGVLKAVSFFGKMASGISGSSWRLPGVLEAVCLFFVFPDNWPLDFVEALEDDLACSRLCFVFWKRALGSFEVPEWHAQGSFCVS